MQVRAQGFRQSGRWGDLDQLLMPTLDAAIPFAQMRRLGAVAEHLHFDMTRAFHEALDIERAVAERGLRLRRGASECLAHLLRLPHHAHAASATASDGLDDRGAVRRNECLGFLCGRRVRAGENRHFQTSVRKGTSRGLVAQPAERRWFRADEDDAGCRASRRKCRTLTEKAVAGVQAVAARGVRHRHNGIDVEIHGCTAAAELHAAIGLGDVQ